MSADREASAVATTRSRLRRSAAQGSASLAWRLLTVALVTLVSLAFPTSALADESDPTATPTSLGNSGRGPQGLVLEGRPVTGGTASDTTSLEPGDYTDTLRGTRALDYAVTRTKAGSTLRVSVVAETGSDGGEIAVQAYSNGASLTCPTSSDTSYSEPGLLSTEIVLVPDDDCGGLEAFRVEVTGSAPDRGLPFLIRVTEEPPVTSQGPAGELLSTLYGPTSESTDKGQIEGGTRFSKAPVLSTGSWSSSLVPGETRLYRVPLDYGQTIQTSVSFAPLSTEQEDELGTSYLDAKLSLLDPMLGRVEEPEGAVLEGTIGEDTLFTGAGSVNRGITNVLAQGSAQLAGSYYVAVTADGISSGNSLLLPFTLDITVSGTPNAGPVHDATGTWRVSQQVTPQAGGDATLSASEQSAVGSGQKSGSLSVVSIVSGTAGLLFIMGGVTMLLRPRRRYHAV